MGIVFRQSIKSTIVTFIGALLGAFITYFGTKIFTMQELGFTRLLINVSVIIQAFIIFGGGSVIAIYLPRYQNDPLRQKTLLSITMLIPLVIMALLMIPYVLFREQIIHAYQAQDQEYIAQYYYYFPLVILPWGYITLLDLYLLTQHKSAVSAFVREVLLRVFNIIVLVAFYLGVIHYHAVIAGTVLVYAGAAAFMVYFSSRTKEFGFAAAWNVFSKTEYKELLHYAWYHLLTSFIAFVMGFLDSNMLAIFDKTGMKSVAIYTIPTFILSVMTIPYRAMSVASVPALNKAYIDEDHVKLRDLFYRSELNILIAGVAMFLVIGCNVHNLVALLPKGYEPTYTLVFILMFGKLIDMGTGLNNELISISKYYKFSFRISIFLVVLLIVLNRLLIPVWGVYGAAWGTTISLSCFNIAKVIFLKRKFDINTLTGKSFLTILLGAISFAAVFWLPKFASPFLDTAFRTVLVMIVYCTLLLIFKPSPDLSSYLESIRKNKRLF